LKGKYLTYPEYQDTGVEWLGDIPDHWDVKKLKFMASVQPSNVDKKTKEGEHPVNLCNYTDVYYNDNVNESLEYMAATATDEQIEKFTLKAGDTIITKDSEDPKDIAIPTYVPNDLPGVVCGYHLAMIRPFDSTYGSFIKRVFESGYARAYFCTRSNGLTRYGLGAYPLSNVFYPRPPKVEALQIANFLDHETAKIDTLIDKQQQLIKLLKEKRQAVISHAVTKGLNPAAPMKDSGVEWLGEVPEHWKFIRARYLFKKEERAVLPELEVITAYRDGQVCLRSNRRADGYTMAILEHGYQRIIPGDLVIHGMDAFAGAIGVSEDEGKSTPEYVVLSPAIDGVCAEFYAHILRLMAQRDYIYVICPSVRERAPRFRFQKLQNGFLPFPPIGEQSEAVKKIRINNELIGELIEKATYQISLLQERRTALISAAVTGKIDVRNWQPALSELGKEG
jgi:type I restriction enzyme S subunit